MDPGHGPEESESEYTSSSSESKGEDVEDTSLDLFISKSDVEANYKLMDRYFTPTKSSIVLSKQLSTREESRDESIAWRHLFTLCGNNDDKSETVAIIGLEHR